MNRFAMSRDYPKAAPNALGRSTHLSDGRVATRRPPNRYASSPFYAVLLPSFTYNAGTKSPNAVAVDRHGNVYESDANGSNYSLNEYFQ